MPVPRSDSPVQYVKGVGPQRAEAFAQLGIRTIGDLLEYYPFRYEINRGEADIVDLRPGAISTVRGTVLAVRPQRGGVRAEISDGTGECKLCWFGQRHDARQVFVGATVVATGQVRVFNDCPEIVQPRIQVFAPDALVCDQGTGAQRVGVYRGNADLKSPTVRRAVENLLAQPQLPIEECLPAHLLSKHKLPGRADAVRQMHAPTNEAALQAARRRLAYEEFLLMELALALRRRKRLALQQGQKLPCTAEIDRRIRARFPFQLTPSQDQVIREIVRDLGSGRPMTRLLQGDVGSGKTVVALYACLVAIANGRQAAVMAPTEILAQQHYRNIEQYLQGSRVRHVLLRGGLGAKERADSRAAIERGAIDLIVGTQALIQKDVAFNDLALVVVDEQHKFGVLQRHQFRTKGPMPHYLVMTATPIPRTLAMTVFGDLDVSLLKHAPPGRGRIITKVVRARQWDTVMQYVRTRLEAGEQAYVVCPRIGAEAATKDAAAADEDAPWYADEPGGRHGGSSATLVATQKTQEDLILGPWQGLQVAVLHGALPRKDQDAVIAAFVAGEIHAVVATTVVEVGVDVPNATIMIVDNADRFGLSQLHQLRGRVGRGTRESLCVLIARGRGAKAAERLAVMAETTDGFKIAEADLRHRGPGQLFGTRQHGLPELRVASILDDFALLEIARQDAFELAAADPALKQPEHQPLLPALRKMFGEKLKLIDAA